MARTLKIDVEALKKQFIAIGKEVETRVNEELTLLAASAHNRISERAQNELHSSRKQYMDALKVDNSQFGTWIIYLEREADWIEDGLKEDFDMKPGLLNGKSSRPYKDGVGRYAIVPFNFSKGPKNMDQKSRDLLADVKKALRGAKIKMGPKGIVLGPDGNPKIGLIAELEMKKSTADLKGLRVYQQVRKDKHGKSFVNQEVMTFRTVTDKQTDKWIHPGTKPKNFFDEAYEWCMKEWENEILPRIIKDFE